MDGKQLSALLMYVVSAAYQPSPEWWSDYLGRVQPTLRHMGVNDLATHLALLNTLGVAPEPDWLDTWCEASEPRLCLFLPAQLHQVSGCGSHHICGSRAISHATAPSSM
jgi:hypothetical protein